jgi:hypothetical protein
MPSIVDLQRAVFERVTSNNPELKAYIDPGLTVYEDYVPDFVESPAVFVEPDRPFVRYQNANRSSLATWSLILTFLVDRIDEQEAQQTLSGYVDSTGVFVAGLQQDDLGDSLSVLSNDSVRVESATNWGIAFDKDKTTSYYAAQIMITIRA